MTSQDGTSRRATIALTLLVLINLFNYIDRQVLAAVESGMEETFFPDAEYPRDPVTNLREDKTIEGKMGSLNTAFMVSYMLIAPLFGFLADRVPRWLLVGVGVTAWSLATGATGLADTFTILFLTRCLVGVGEAAYGPVAPTVISDLYPVQKRGSVMAIFYAAIPVGSALGYVLGGQVMAWAGGDWRWAFFVVVPPGLLLGLWCFLMRDPPRGSADLGAPPGGTGIREGEPPFRATPSPNATSVTRKATWADYLAMIKTPSYLLTTLGMTAMTFAMGGIAFWMPRYGVERQAVAVLTPEDEARIVRRYAQPDASPKERADVIQTQAVDYLKAGGESNDPTLRAKLNDLRSEVNLTFGIIVVVSGLGATILGGIVADRLKTRISGAYFLVSAVAMATAFPLILAALSVPFPAAWVFIFLACFCLFFNTGPTNTILANVTHPAIRASAFALNILVIHALGDAISPAIIGLINGYTGGMTYGFLAVSFMCLLASILWAAGIRHLARDTELAPTRIGAAPGS